MIIRTKFTPREYLKKNDIEYSIRCVRAVLDSIGLGRFYYKVLGSIDLGNRYYDLVEIAKNLANDNLLLELGLYDNDFIPELKRGVVLSFKDILSLKNKNSDLSEGDAELQEDVINFAKEYPELIKIQKTNIQIIKGWLKIGHPIVCDVDFWQLHSKYDDSIRSVAVYGIDIGKKEVYVWDPLFKHSKIKVKTFIHSWEQAGGYYLVISKSS